MSEHPAAVAAARCIGVSIEDFWKLDEDDCFELIDDELRLTYFTDSSLSATSSWYIHLSIFYKKKELLRTRSLCFGPRRYLTRWEAYTRCKRQLGGLREKLKKVEELKTIAKGIAKKGKAEWELQNEQPCVKATPRGI